MFYTRPDIRPLGWDLTDLNSNGVFYFVGHTTDDRLVEIKYRSSWLQVWLGDAGEDTTGYKDPILKLRIGPPYHSSILEEQLCDLLGLTINGETPVLTDEQRLAAAEFKRILDWSGRATYWQSWHYMFDDEVQLLINDFRKAFSDSCLIQFQSNVSRHGQKKQYRQKEFWTASDDHLTIGIGFDPLRLKKVLCSEHVTQKEAQEIFVHRIDIDCIDLPDGCHNRVYGKTFIDKYGADKLDLGRVDI